MWRLVIRSILLAVLVQATAGAIQNSDTHTSAEPQQLTITRNLTSMPLAFTENQGQWDERVKYRANTGGAALWFTNEGVYYQFTRWIPSDGADITLNELEGESSLNRQSSLNRHSRAGGNLYPPAAYYHMATCLRGGDGERAGVTERHKLVGPDLQEMSVSGYKQPDLQTDYGGLNGEC